MTTTRTSELTIVDETDLWAQLKNRDLDVTLLTDYYRHKLWALWRQEVEVDGNTESDALETLASEADSMLEGCRRAFCPKCGSTDLIEVRDATAYLKIRSVYLKENPCLLSEQEPSDGISVMDSTELIRCSDCDFESESIDPFLDTAGLGVAEHGATVIVPFVHVTSCLMSDGTLAAQVHMYDEKMEEWGKLTGADRDTVPLPVPSDAGPDEIETALQIVAGQVTDLREAIVSANEPILRRGDTFDLGELFEPLEWSVIAEYAKTLQNR